MLQRGETNQHSRYEFRALEPHRLFVESEGLIADPRHAKQAQKQPCGERELFMIIKKSKRGGHPNTVATTPPVHCWWHASLRTKRFPPGL